MDKYRLINIGGLREILSSDPENLAAAVTLCHLAQDREMTEELLRKFLMGLKLWKDMQKQLSSGTCLLVINTTTERNQLFENIKLFIELLFKQLGDAASVDPLRYLSAYIFEQSGNFETALSTLSDLISVQSQDSGVTMCSLILRASTILLYMERYAEAIEYLEYINDKEIAIEPFSRLLILSLLTIAYEMSSGHLWLLESTIEKLCQMFSEECDWSYEQVLCEIARHQINSSDYLCSLLILQRALSLSPSTHTALFPLAAVCYLLGMQSKAKEYAEMAMAARLSGSELNDLLLAISPTSYVENLTQSDAQLHITECNIPHNSIVSIFHDTFEVSSGLTVSPKSVVSANIPNALGENLSYRFLPSLKNSTVSVENPLKRQPVKSFPKLDEDANRYLSLLRDPRKSFFVYDKRILILREIESNL